MGMGFGYLGASGKTYTFLLVDMANPKALPWHGGVFAFAKYTPEPLFFGEGMNLNETIRTSSEWANLEKDHREITLAYFLLEEDSEKRAAILADLVERYRPRLNHQK